MDNFYKRLKWMRSFSFKFRRTLLLLVCLLAAVLAPSQTTETYETEIPASTTFSEAGMSFNISGHFLIEQSVNFGCCPSDRFMSTGLNNGGSSGSVGQVILSTQGKGFQLQEMDVWSSNNDGNSFAVGNATFIGIRPNGTTVSYTTDINPTGNTGTSFEHLNFAGSPLAGINLIGLEIVLVSGINYIAIDNFKFLSVDIPTITINDISTTEGNSGTKILTLTATLTNAAPGAFTVNFASADNTATTSNSDYVSSSGTLNFSGTNGETELINITLNGDTQFESDETFFVNLSNASLPGVRIFDPQGIGTIQNDDAGSGLSITAANASKIEGNSGTTPFFFTVSRTVDVSGSTTVNYAVTGSSGNPANSADFGGTFPSGTVSFAPLESVKQVQINVSGDLTDENNEGFTITLSNPSAGAAIISGTATGTIIDDDMIIETFEDETAPGFIFSENGNNFTAVSPMRVAFGSGFGCCPSSYYLENIPPGNNGSINFSNAGIGGFVLQEFDAWTSSNSGSNFAVGNVTFTGTLASGGSVMHTFTITPTGDTGSDFEHKSFAATPFANQVLRSVSVNIVSPLNYIQIDNLKYGLGTAGLLSINDVSIMEGNAGTQILTFTVTHTGTSPAFTVNYATANNSATAGSDYTSTSGMLSFSGTNNETKTVAVTIQGDMLVELDETFLVNLSSISNSSVTLQDGQGIGTIQNNDAASISISDVSLSEGNSGTSNFTFTATLNQAVNTAISVDFSTANGTASAGTDYTANSGLISFAGTAGEMKTIIISVNGDTDFEPNETFFVNLANVLAGGRNVTISDNQGLGTIQNDDPNPVPEIAVEGNGNPIADGATMVSTMNLTDFGTVCVGGTPVEHSFSILNTGAVDLVLDGSPRVSLTGHTTDFTVTLQPSAFVTSMGNSAFDIEFHPTASGNRSVTVTIENNDSDEDPFTFVVQGMANPAENAAFAYSQNGYCHLDSDPTPTIFGTMGGTFLANSAVIINSTTGQIDVSASTAGGPYIVTYTTGGPCSQSEDFSIFISNCLPDATLSDAIIIDSGNPGQAEPGDRIQLTATIENNQDADYKNLQIVLNNDSKVSFVSGSFKTTPLAIDDSYVASQDIMLSIVVGNGLLTNDFDDNIPGLMITAFDAVSVEGGTVIVNSNGSFTYNPPNGFTGNDSFNYTITDSDLQTNSATVKIRVQ